MILIAPEIKYCDALMGGPRSVAAADGTEAVPPGLDSRNISSPEQ